MSHGSDGRPTFDRGRTAWQRTWRPAIGPKDTIADLGPIAPNQDGASAGPGATSIITAERAGETVNGTLLASILVKDADGFYATCTARGVRFTVSQPR